MALSDAYDLLKATAADIYRERVAVTAHLARKLVIESELDVFDTGDAGKIAVQRALDADRAAYRAIAARWASKMDTAMAYWGTQLTVPSAYTKGGAPLDRKALLRDIRAHMVTNNLSVTQRRVSYAAEPSPDDNGILDRLTVDEDGSTVSAGLHNQTVDAFVSSKPSQYRSIMTIRPRNKGTDIFSLIGPDGALPVEAVNDAFSGPGLVLNPSLNQGISSSSNGADLSGDTANAGWVLTKTGSPTHTWDTSIKYRGLTGSHKLYGDSTSRTWTQPLVIADAHRKLPRNYMVAIYKTGTPVGTVTITCGNKSQAWNLGDLSSGWNYLRLDRDKDLFPKNFDTSGATLAVAIVCTSGTSSSSYVNFAFVGGQVYQQFDGPFYGHWSRNGISTLSLASAAAFTFADTMSQEGIVPWAVYLAYHLTGDRSAGYLPESSAPTIADPSPFAPEIAVTRSGSNVADGGSVALGTVGAASEHLVTLRVLNSGNGPLAIGVPVDVGGATNATLTDTGISLPQAIAPGEYLDVIVGVTDGGAGAFSLTIRIDNNDASEGTYEITISGTAA